MQGLIEVSSGQEKQEEKRNIKKVFALVVLCLSTSIPSSRSIVTSYLNSAPRLRLFFADQTLQESASGAFVSGSAVRLCLWRSAIRERSMNDSKLIC
jgi:hypothetical protein